jgi:hypothetical protein
VQLNPAQTAASRQNIGIPSVFPHAQPALSDKSLVNSLIENAQRILDTAVDAGQSGLKSSDWTIFVGPEGGLEMIAGAESPLDSLTWSRGARMAWQLRHAGDGIRVEGRSALERCRLETEAPSRAARMLLGSERLYQFASPA